MTSKEENELDYVDSVVTFLINISEENARSFAVDMWRFYPVETQHLLNALEATQNIQKIPRLLQKGI